MTTDTATRQEKTAAPVRVLLASVLGLLGAMLLPLAVPALAPVASAHDTLVSSTPATGESLEQAPERIELTYSDEVLDLSPAVRLTNAAGEEILAEAPTVTGTTATVELPPLPADDYQLQWRVVSSDGHPIEGTVDFTVTAGAGDGPPGGEVATGTAAPTTAPTAPEAAPTPVDQAEAPPTDADAGGTGLGWLLARLGVLLVLALGVLGVVAVVRRRGNRGADAD